MRKAGVWELRQSWLELNLNPGSITPGLSESHVPPWPQFSHLSDGAKQSDVTTAV